MDDELKQEFGRLSQRVPEGRPDVREVTQQGRWMRWRRTAIVAGVLVVVLVASGVGMKSVLESSRRIPPNVVEVGGHSGDGQFVPAEEGEATYLLSDFEIHYPYRAIDHMQKMEPGSERREQYCSARPSSCEVLTDHAGVSFRWHWATSKYPGDLDCEIRLYDDKDSLVGSAIMGLSGLEPQSRGAGSVIPIAVSKEPVRAEGGCEGSRYEPGGGWRISFLRAEPYTPTHPTGDAPPEDRIRLIFDVEELGEHTDSRMCRMTVWFESGRVKRGEFTTNSGKVFENMETAYPASDPVTDAKIVCGAIEASPTPMDLTRPGHYEFSDFAYRSTKNGASTRITYTITWSGDGFPGTDEGCFLEIDTADGTQRFGPFSMTSVDPKAEGGNKVPVPAEEIEHVDIECRGASKR